MGSVLSDSRSIGVAAGALLVALIFGLRDVLLARYRDLPKHGRNSRRRSTPAAHSSDPAEAGAKPSPEQDKHDVPAPPRGREHDARALEDTARRRIAYLLIGLLALYVAVPQAMVIFGVIAVDDVKEFNVIVSPFMTLVTAATSFYYAKER